MSSVLVLMAVSTVLLAERQKCAVCQARKMPLQSRKPLVQALGAGHKKRLHNYLMVSIIQYWIPFSYVTQILPAHLQEAAIMDSQ